LTKADIAESIASHAEISRRQATKIVDLFLSEIQSALQKGERVALTPFGSFVVRARKAREGRNPKTGAAIDIPARKVAAFVAGKSLKTALSGHRNGVRKTAKAEGRTS
jgi:nucleoid DNA-binding protein